jgi:gamma-glutamyl-gamma-aminobutyrate hydrolase PuuD
MIIGLTQRVLVHKERAYDSLEHGWYSCLKGHTLVAVSNRTNVEVDADLLIVTGGDNHPVRDLIENRLIQQFMLESKPIIGICHGAFLLTNMFGGKVGSVEGHMDSEHLINGTQLVNSYHTLQIEEPPKQATVLATDEQGCCESWIYKNIGAVVWHPERMNEPYWPKKIKDLFRE